MVRACNQSAGAAGAHTSNARRIARTDRGGCARPARTDRRERDPNASVNTRKLTRGNLTIIETYA